MELAKIFSDNMVFQANKPIRIFGNGCGRICVDFLGKSFDGVFDKDKWCLVLDSFDYGGPYEMFISLNEEKHVLKNVMLGDVLLCAGQSNIQFEIREQINPETVLPNENVRCYIQDQIGHCSTFNSNNGWVIVSRDNIRGFSAVGFHTADEMNKKSGHAIGLVGCFRGMSVIRSWSNREDLTEDVFVPLKMRHSSSTLDRAIKWNTDCALYEYTFLPVAPFSFHSVIWYQGESNASMAESRVYATQLKRLVARYRKDLNDDDLTFVIIEICDFVNAYKDAWFAIQKAQSVAASHLENCIYVTSSDVCEHEHIHPVDKRALSRKIAELL